MRNIDLGIFNQILNNISNSLEILFLKKFENFWTYILKIFEKIFSNLLKKYFENFWKRFGKFWKKYLDNFGKKYFEKNIKKFFEKILWNFLKKYFENFGKNILKIFEKYLNQNIFYDISQSAAPSKHHKSYGKSFKKFVGGVVVVACLIIVSLQVLESDLELDNNV